MDKDTKPEKIRRPIDLVRIQQRELESRLRTIYELRTGAERSRTEKDALEREVRGCRSRLGDAAVLFEDGAMILRDVAKDPRVAGTIKSRAEAWIRRATDFKRPEDESPF